MHLTPLLGRTARALRLPHLLMLAALLAVPAVRADPEPTAPHNIILADLGLHVIGIGYQRSIAPWIALQVDFDSYSPWTQNNNLLNGSPGYESDLKGYVIRFRPIFYGLTETPYPSGAPTGFWISPFYQWGIATASKDLVPTKGHVWAAGLSFGYSWLFFGHLALMLGGGAQYHVAYIPNSSNIYPPSFARLYPTLDANLGFAF